MVKSTDRLLSQLNQSGLQIKDNPLYQVIKQLIDRIKELESLTGGGNTTNTINNVLQQYIIEDGGSGGSGEDGAAIPGPTGPQGSTGATGAAGPVTLGPMGLDELIVEEVVMQVGPQGPQGNPGSTGPSSPLMWLAEDGLPGEDGMSLPPQVLGGWSLLATQVAAGAASYSFTGLGGYTDILVLLRNVTLSLTALITMRVSTDGGATYLAASGDYVSVSGAGIEANLTALRFNGVNNTAARSGFLKIEGFNIDTIPKPVHANFFTTDAIGFQYGTNTSPYNAVQVLNSGAGNLNAGTIYVLGRR